MGKKTVVGEDGKRYHIKVKKPFYKKIWFWVVLVIVAIGMSGLGDKDVPEVAKSQEESSDIKGQKEVAKPIKKESVTTKENKSQKEEKSEPTKEVESDIPTEYKSALKSGESYGKRMHMSKQGIYDQLSSEYGEQFSAEAAQYAIENLDIDYNENALASAKSYATTMNMSKIGVYKQLISEHGEKFTPEEGQYAIDNIKADWQANALASAKNYQETMAMSPEAIRDQLVSEYGEQFTVEEADYAIQNLD